MAKLFLTDRTRAALRPSDTVSPRINQIADRYLEIVRSREPAVRCLFSREDWAAMVEAAYRVIADPVMAVDSHGWLARQIQDECPAAADMIREELGSFDALVLLELLERDHAEAALATHS